VYQATDELQVRLRDVPVAYGNRDHHRLFLVVAPSMKKAAVQDENMLAIYNTTDRDGVYDAKSRLTYIRFGDLPEIHPMFLQDCWRDVIFKVAALASYKSMFVNFNFHVGLHYQYLDIFEQHFEQLRHQEIESVASHTGIGAVESYWKNTLEASDCELGRTPQWSLEFDVPDWSGVAEQLPTYRGMRVRFIFRENHSEWFFY
jgi:hypothetical protein